MDITYVVAFVLAIVYLDSGFRNKVQLFAYHTIVVYSDVVIYSVIYSCTPMMHYFVMRCSISGRICIVLYI